MVLPNATATASATSLAERVSVPTGRVPLDLSMLEWPADDYVFKPPQWWDDTLTYAECVEAQGPAPERCHTGRPGS